MYRSIKIQVLNRAVHIQKYDIKFYFNYLINNKELKNYGTSVLRALYLVRQRGVKEKSKKKEKEKKEACCVC